MKERLANDLAFAGRCYQELFAGENTDEAEAAAVQFAEFIARAVNYLTPK